MINDILPNFKYVKEEASYRLILKKALVRKGILLTEKIKRLDTIYLLELALILDSLNGGREVK